MSNTDRAQTLASLLASYPELSPALAASHHAYRLDEFGPNTRAVYPPAEFASDSGSYYITGRGRSVLGEAADAIAREHGFRDYIFVHVPSDPLGRTFRILILED